MKKIVGFVMVAVLAASACKKDDNKCPEPGISAPASETAALKTYLDTNHITATADGRGFFYNITTPGTGAHPTICNAVNVAYTGKFINGATFDSSSDITFPLGGVITGWQEAIPLIGKGGSMIMYLPPSLAYGSAGRPGIPANSILIFTVDLKAIY